MKTRIALGAIFILGVVASITATRAQSASTRYVIDGTTYDVPRDHDIASSENAALRGTDEEPADSVWLTFPAAELASSIPGFNRSVRGYSSNVDAALTVNVLGGKEAREFPRDRADSAKTIRELARSSGAKLPDIKTGMTRVIEMDMGRGSSWYLIPPTGQPVLADRLPPACKSSKDNQDRDLYACQFTILRGGQLFVFSLNEENMLLADRIVDFVIKRLREWQRR